MDVFALLRASREELLRNAATLEMAHTCRNNGGGGIGGGGARPDPARRFGSNTAVPAPVLAFEGRGPFQPTTSGGTLVALGAPHPAASAARYHGLPPSSATASPFVGGGGGGEWNAFRPGPSSVTARYAAVATTATARGGHRAERSVAGSPRAPISRQLLRAICGHLNDLSLSDTAAAVDATDRRSAYCRSPPPAKALGDWEADETHPEWRGWAGGRTARSEGESPLAVVEGAGQLGSTQTTEGKWGRDDRWPGNGSQTDKAADDGDATYAVMQAYGAYRLATWAMTHRHQPDASPAREASAAAKPAWSMTQRQVNVHSEFRVHGSLKLTRRWASCEEFSVICDPDVEPPRAPASTTGGSDDGEDDAARRGAGRKRRAAPDAAGPPVQVELKDLFGPRYLFIEANSGDFSPYVLILPLMARMLAVSCPGMNCIVHFPPDVTRSGGGSARTLAKVYPNALRGNVPAPGEEKKEKRVQTADAAAAAAAVTKAERDQSGASDDSARDRRVTLNASAADQALTQFKARTSAYYQCGWESLTLPMTRVPYAGPGTERLSLLRVHADSWRVCSTHRGVLFEGNRRASRTQMPPRHLPANVLNSLLVMVLQQQNARQEMLLLKQAEEEERGGITTDAPSLYTRTAPTDSDAGPEETTLLVRYDNGSSVDVVTTRDPVSYAVRKCRRLGDIPTVVFCVNQKVGSERLVMQDRRWLRRHFAKCARLSSPSATATTAAPDTSGHGACACVKGTLAEENVFVVDIGQSVRGGTTAAAGPHQQRNVATAPKLGGVGRAAATHTPLRSARPGETMAWPSRMSGLSRPPFMGAAMSSSADQMTSPPPTRPSQEAGGGQRGDRSSAPRSTAPRPDHVEQREALEALCSMHRGR